MTSYSCRSGGATHPGCVRTHNEDAYVARPDIGLWAVADGAGGHEAGDVASGLVAETLSAIPAGLSACEVLAQVRLRIAVVHQALRDQARQSGPNVLVATTVVVLLVRGGHFACLWAGDSRAYLFRAGALQQITRDHSLVQEMVDSGALDASEAALHPRGNVITRAVGADADGIELDKCSDRLRLGDRFLLCSDGLFKALTDADIAECLRCKFDVDAAACLVAAALARNATDNVTAIAIEAQPSGDEETESTLS